MSLEPRDSDRDASRGVGDENMRREHCSDALALWEYEGLKLLDFYRRYKVQGNPVTWRQGKGPISERGKGERLIYKKDYGHFFNSTRDISSTAPLRPEYRTDIDKHG